MGFKDLKCNRSKLKKVYLKHTSHAVFFCKRNLFSYKAGTRKIKIKSKIKEILQNY